jgi:xanthine dehydrogenase accessory factor
MLVFPDGSQRGTLGGGCVEAEVKQRALSVFASAGAQPQVLTFHLDDNYGWDDGLICGGRMTILADPLTSGTVPRADIQSYFQRFRVLVDGGRGCTEVIALDKQEATGAGSRFLFDGSRQVVSQIIWPGGNGSQGPDGWLGNISAHVVPLGQRPRPVVHLGFAFLPILPRVTLLIVGGGHVGQAVARLAADVDFDIWVVDDRELYASRARFPSAQRLLVGDIGKILQELIPSLDPFSFCLIVTRGHHHDEEALYHLAQTGAGYIGMIGSKRKIKLIFEDLIAKGIPQENLDCIHAPLGFAIGSQTVPEIAISIVAELIACRNLGNVYRQERQDPKERAAARQQVS